MPNPIKKQIDWNSIPLFLAVARVGRLTTTARQLGIDHSTLGRKLTGLEQALRAKLFSRQRNGYSLTPQGEQLMNLAVEIEGQVSAIMSEIGGADLRVAGNVRVGAPDGIGARFLAPRLGMLSQEHPDLDVELVVVPRIFSLTRRDADIAVSLTRPKEGGLHARKLTDYELGLYCSHDLRKVWDGDTLDKLRGAPFIGYIDDLILCRELDYASSISRDMRTVLKSASLLAQVAATTAGAGFCVLPCFIADQESSLQRVFPNQISVVRSFWVLIHSELRDLARVRVTVEFLTKQFQESRHAFLTSELGESTASKTSSNARRMGVSLAI